MRVATTRLAPVIARLRVLRAIVRIRAPPARIEILPPGAFTSSGSEEGNQMAATIVTARTNTDDENHAALRWASRGYDPVFSASKSSWTAYDSNCHQKRRFLEQRN
jgi:hypothetical protein